MNKVKIVLPSELTKYNLPKDVKIRLKEYYRVKANYLNKKADIVDLKIAYSYAYQDIKNLMHRGFISENMFNPLIDLLQEGL